MTPPPPTPADSFSATWLQQREPFDARARDSAAPRLALASRLAALRPPGDTPWRVMDLACGTGANLRWLAPRLGGAQQWLVVDHDAALLRCWPRMLAAAQGRAPQRVAAGQPLRFAAPGVEAQVLRRRLDLAQQLEALPWPAAHLVTASALLDLVSASWLQRLTAAATASRVALLLALSVDGRHVWAPRDPFDAAVGARFAAHQQRDKGFGPARGAQAVPMLQRLLQAAGYRVHLARSDWWLDGRSDSAALALQRALVDGIAGAACEQDPAAAAAVQAWRQRRQALAPRSTLRVGHLELLALPPR